MYDIGYAIHNKKGEIVCAKNALVDEVFTNGKQMMGAFYARKMFSHYSRMMCDGKVTLRTWDYIIAEMQADMAEHKVKAFAAYNLGFDLRAINQTAVDLKKETVDISGIKLLDIWQFSCEVLLNKRTYKKIAEAQNWKTDKGNYKTSAEMVYRYLTTDYNFEEDHTAASDVEIEVKILAACFKRKKKIPYGIYNKSPWKLVNKK